MKALVYHKPKDIRYEDHVDPKIQKGRDAIIRVTSTAICGSDPHIYNGLFPQKHPMVMGHEMPLEQGPHGYEIFDKKEDNCVKVVLKP